DSPENECPSFARAVARRGWLVCPRAPVSCPGGGATWSVADAARVVGSSLEELEARYPGRVAADDRTLIGFSLGAFVAADLVRRASPRWSRVLLIGAKVDVDARSLERHGVQRLLFAAGDYDRANSHMAGTARRLSRAGLDVSFRSLGPVGHRFALDMDAWSES